MANLRIKSGGGSPQHILSEPEFAALAKALKVPFDCCAKARLQFVVDQCLSWLPLRHDVSTQPIHRFFPQMEQRFRTIAAELQKWEAEQQHDLHVYAQYVFDKNRPHSSDPDWVHWPLHLKYAADAFAAAREETRRHELPSKTGPNNSELVNLVAHLADFSESVGVTPSVAYDAYKDDRLTPFVEFADALRKILSAHLPFSKAQTVSIARNALSKRAKIQARNRSGKNSANSLAPILGPSPGTLLGRSLAKGKKLGICTECGESYATKTMSIDRKQMPIERRPPKRLKVAPANRAKRKPAKHFGKTKGTHSQN